MARYSGDSRRRERFRDARLLARGLRRGIFPFGIADFYGSVSNAPDTVVGMQSTPDGAGYWVATSTGGIFPFGDAEFLGSPGINLASPIVGIEATPDGKGYWLAAADGGII